MLVIYRSVTPRRHGAPVVYEQAAPVKWCCVEMCRWWGVLIGFGVRDHAASTNQTVNLYCDRPQANGTTILEVVPVACCPWCGEAVETCREKFAAKHRRRGIINAKSRGCPPGSRARFLPAVVLLLHGGTTHRASKAVVYDYARFMVASRLHPDSGRFRVVLSAVAPDATCHPVILAGRCRPRPAVAICAAC
jgi:hypothetical protein